MRYRRLGSTDLKVSEVGFGMWTVATDWWGKVEAPKAISLLRKALDLGVNFFDTADTYGDGRGETLLREALGEWREDIVIATKFGYDIYSGEPREGQTERKQRWDPDFIEYACQQSLKRLGTDHIDLYQLHNPRMEAMASEALWETLECLREEGLIGAYGVALGPAIGWRDEGVRAMEDRGVASLQTVYNLLEQDPGRDFFQVARKTGTSILVRVPHSSGLLEGNLTPDTTFDPKDHRSFRPKEWLTEGLKKVEQLSFLTRTRTLGQAAIKFALAEATVAAVLPNIYGEEQLLEFAEAPSVPDLSPEELAEVEGLYARNFGSVKG
jgi:aryl-alcohol dehydrogenase-like predicted oxidoreductase